MTATKPELENVTIRICPACGVVNPSGPSESCPHLQLARFDGVDESMMDLLDDVAQARKAFQERLSTLKALVKRAVREGDADIETPRKVRRVSEVEELRRPAPRSLKAFTLELPDAQRNRPTPKKTNPARLRKSKPSPSTVDPRQLDLLVKLPPKGDA